MSTPQPPAGPGRSVVAAADVRHAVLDPAPGSEPCVFRDARIEGALALDGAEITRLVRFEDCTFDGPVTLEGASTLAFAVTGCTLPAFHAPTAQIGGRLDLRGSTVTGGGRRGAVNLVHTHIAGGLRLDRAHLVNDEGLAVNAGGLVMQGGVFCEDFVAHGRFVLPGAELPGGLWMHGARIVAAAPDEIAFNGDALRASTVRLNRGWRADGRVRLRGARIDDLLSFHDAELLGQGASLMCVGAQLGAIDLRLARPPAGGVDLRNAHATRIQDRPGTWRSPLGLDGLTYDWVEPTAATQREDATHRLAWLRLQTRYVPQPYEQLASYYRRLGHESEARRVLLVRERRRRALLGPAGRVWGGLLDATVGYGYRPWLAGLWLALLTLLGSLAFRTHAPVPNKAGEGPPFHPVAYALDLLIPVGGLGQRDVWHWAQPWLQNLAYGLIAVGWVLTTAVVAGVTRTLNRT
ncbi:oxidoreductase [Streptomyces sp. SID5785]|uniref:pentapeptide repeat-containing protein n=1 Tax=Streptomyces sp. SID5785 TaxID=2690309 RepID=UPI001361AD5A|nr:pentapeptide repeat-containing protein [Streptomyces sp. SID5785]MZD06743.1 oxidoreductase [Streptomyces sp. SID5785]